MSAVGDLPGGVCLRGPVRTCVACRRRASKAELIRVIASDGAVVVDEAHRLPGRGAYLHRDSGCVSMAARKGVLPRALRAVGPLEMTALEGLE